AGALAETHALPGIPGTRTQQQPCRKLHATRSAWSQKLDPHRQPASRTQSCRHPLRRRNLPTDEHSRAPILGGGPPRSRRNSHPSPAQTHPYSLGHALTATVNHVVALTLTKELV